MSNSPAGTEELLKTVENARLFEFEFGAPKFDSPATKFEFGATKFGCATRKFEFGAPNFEFGTPKYEFEYGFSWFFVRFWQMSKMDKKQLFL